MWAVVFVGYLYFSIAQSFSLRTRTNSSYPWLESLEACSKINMTLASQRDVCNTTVLHPSQTEPYWIQELYIIKMFEKVENSSAYNDSYSITINNENIRNQCTGTGTNSTCSGCNDDACNSNLVQLSSFNQFKHPLTPNVTYRIGYVNYTSILEEKHPSMLIFCVLYYNGKIFYDKCSNQRRAVCISGDIQKYVVSKIESLIERYPHQPSSAGGSTTITNTISCHTDFNLTSNTITPSNNDILKEARTNATTLYIIIAVSVLGTVVVGILILSCAACLFRRKTSGAQKGHRSMNKRRKDKIDMFETYSEVVDSVARQELSQDLCPDFDKLDIVQYSTPDDALKCEITGQREECTIYSRLDPTKKVDTSKANTENNFDANIYHHGNIIIDANVYDTINNTMKKVILDPNYDHLPTESYGKV